MFKSYLSRVVNPGIGIHLPASIEEIRDAYAMLNGTDTIPLETVTAYIVSSVPNMHRYLYEVPVTKHTLEELNYLAYRVEWMDWQDERVFGAAIEMRKQDTLAEMINLSCNLDKFEYLPGVTTVTKLGKHLIDRNADMVPEKCKAYPDYDQG